MTSCDWPVSLSLHCDKDPLDKQAILPIHRATWQKEIYGGLAQDHKNDLEVDRLLTPETETFPVWWFYPSSPEEPHQ